MNQLIDGAHYGTWAGHYESYRDRRVPLFYLADGSPVYFRDVLWHPDRRRVGWCCIANFTVDANDETVTVNSPNGAVPNVFIKDLRRESPEEISITCPTCHGMGRITQLR